MAWTKLKGQNFRAFVDSTAVPEAVNCSVQISGSMEDASTKDSVGSYVTEDMVSRGWNVQVEHQDASLATLRALITAFNSDTPLMVGWDQTAGAQNRVAQNADFARSGSALLTDLTIQADNRTTISVSCQYTGTGGLA